MLCELHALCRCLTLKDSENNTEHVYIGLFHDLYFNYYILLCVFINEL